MTDKQLARLRASMEKWGFIVPIVTNKDYLIADGEQRLTIAKQLGLKEVLVIRLPVDEVDRRILRQVLNKLRGEHDFMADAQEFLRIVEAGHEKDLKYLLQLSDNQLDKYLEALKEDQDPGVGVKSIYEVVIDCSSEQEQERVYNELTEKGYKCRVLIL